MDRPPRRTITGVKSRRMRLSTTPFESSRRDLFDFNGFGRFWPWVCAKNCKSSTFSKKKYTFKILTLSSLNQFNQKAVKLRPSWKIHVCNAFFTKNVVLGPKCLKTIKFRQISARAFERCGREPHTMKFDPSYDMSKLRARKWESQHFLILRSLWLSWTLRARVYISYSKHFLSK